MADSDGKLSRARQRLEAGLARHRAGDWAGAEASYRAALEAAPGLADAHHLLGLSLAQQGRAEEGAREIEAAIAAAPEAAAYRGNLAKLQLRLGRGDEAEANFRELLRHQPEDADALYNYAELLTQKKRYGEALTLLQRLGALLPEDPAIGNARAATLLRAGKPAEALELLEPLTAEHAGFAEALHNKATALGELGRIPESETAAKAAVAAQPNLSGAQWHLGLCRYDRGDLQGAVAAFRDAAACRPPTPLAAPYLEACLAETGAAPPASPAAGAEAEALREAWRLRGELGTGVPAFGFKASHLRHALAAAEAPGLYMEFGVYTGRSITLIALTLGADTPVHGFDSFEGLPEDWIEGEAKGAYDAGGTLPAVPENVWLHPGWFEDSLPVFLRQQKAPVAFANIDCDIYSSTRTVLEQLAPRLGPGSVLVFDEYFAYPGWRDHEYRAFQEFVAERGLAYELLALSPFTRQATIRIGGGK